jgi:outer membrane protein TolC
MRQLSHRYATTTARRTAAAALTWLLLLAPVAGAAEVSTTAGNGVDEIKDLSELGVTVTDGEARLRLEDAVSAALRRNLFLIVERYRRSQTIQGIEEALGIYDLNLGADSTYSENTSPTSSTLEAAEVLVTDRLSANVNLSQLTPYGGVASLAFLNSRFASSNAFVQPNPQFGVTFGLQFDQPLLRNFGREVTDQGILIARTNTAISREDFQTQVEGNIQQVSDTYWQLVEAREQLTVAEESLSLAEDLHKMNKIQVEVGTMAPLETVQSEAGVATREEDIIRRQAAVEDSADALRRLVNLDRLELWDVGIVPVTEPEIEHVAIDVGEAIDVALENRPDVRRQRLVIKNSELEARVAHNQKKPRLDLQANYGLNAVDGDLSDPETGVLVEPGGYSDALQQILDIDFDGWSVGLTFAYPLQNRTARARSVRADLALEQVDVELRDLEQGVVAEVRRTARAVETAAKQIESAKVSSRLARENLNAEQKRYENGLSTSFQVLEIQEDLSQARSREVSAVIAYRRALTDYQRSVGRLLDTYGVELASDGAEE